MDLKLLSKKRRLRTIAIVLLFSLVLVYIGIKLATSNNTSDKPIPVSEMSPPFPSQIEAGCQTVLCWDGITIGSTTMNDAQALLEAKYGGRNVTLDRSRISWSTGQNDVYQAGSVFATFDQDTITGIYIYFAANQLFVADLIADIGEPAYVFVSSWNCSGASLVFDESWIRAYLIPIDTFVGVRPSQAIDSLSLSLRATEETVTNVLDGLIMKWQGYADYCELAFEQ